MKVLQEKDALITEEYIIKLTGEEYLNLIEELKTSGSTWAEKFKVTLIQAKQFLDGL